MIDKFYNVENDATKTFIMVGEPIREILGGSGASPSDMDSDKVAPGSLDKGKDIPIESYFEGLDG